MGKSVIGSSEQIALLRDVEHLRGAYSRFNKYFSLYELRCQHDLEVADDKTRLNILESASNVLMEANEDLQDQIDKIEEQFGDLPDFKEHVSEEMVEMSERLQKDLARYKDLMNEEFKKRVSPKSFWRFAGDFFKSFW